MRFHFLILACATVLNGAAVSWADTIPVKFTGVADGSNLTLTLAGQTVSGEVGIYQWMQTNYVAGDGMPANFFTFCIEILQDISTGTTYSDYSLTALTNAPKPGIGLSGGSGTMSSTQAGELAALWYQDIGNINSVDGAATFQIAVWDILYGTFQYASSGNLTIKPYSGGGSSANLQADVTTAAQWATPSNLTGPQSNLMAFSSLTAQDQIVVYSPANGGFTPVPLPSAAWTTLALLTGLGLFRLRAVNGLRLF